MTAFSPPHPPAPPHPPVKSQLSATSTRCPEIPVTQQAQPGARRGRACPKTSCLMAELQASHHLPSCPSCLQGVCEGEFGGGGFWDDCGQLKPSVWASDYLKSLPLAPPPLLNANLQDGQAPGVLRAGPAQRLPQKQAGEVGEVYSAPSLSLGSLTQGMGGEGLFKPWLCCFLL